LKIVFNFHHHHHHHHHHPSPSPIHEFKQKREKRDNQSNNNDVKHLHHWRAIHTAGNLHTHNDKTKRTTNKNDITIVDGVKIINFVCSLLLSNVFP